MLSDTNNGQIKTIECFYRTLELGYEFFGIQAGNECWGGANAAERYDMYGKGKGKCTAQLGGPFYNTVFLINYPDGMLKRFLYE